MAFLQKSRNDCDNLKLITPEEFDIKFKNGYVDKYMIQYFIENVNDQININLIKHLISKGIVSKERVMWFIFYYKIYEHYYEINDILTMKIRINTLNKFEFIIDSVESLILKKAVNERDVNSVKFLMKLRIEEKNQIPSLEPTIIIRDATEVIIDSFFEFSAQKGNILNVKECIDFLNAIDIIPNKYFYKKLFLSSCEYIDENFVFDILESFKENNIDFLNELSDEILNTNVEHLFITSYLIGNKILDIKLLSDYLIRHEIILYERILYSFPDEYKLFHAIYYDNLDMFRYYSKNVEITEYYFLLFASKDINDTQSYIYNEMLDFFMKDFDCFSYFVENENDIACELIFKLYPEFCNRSNLDIIISNYLLISLDFLLNYGVIKTKKELIELYKGDDIEICNILKEYSLKQFV